MSVEGSCDWLEVQGGQDTLAPGETEEILVEVNSSGMEAGVYSCILSVSDPLAANTPVQIPVELTIAGPVLEVSTHEIKVHTIQGWSPHEAELLTIRNAGGGRMNWSVSDPSVQWLTIDRLQGTLGPCLDKELALQFHTEGLSAGLYTTDLLIDGGSAVNSPQSVQVELLVEAGHVRRIPLQHPTIQAAIDAAQDGDIVLVADGTYTGDGNQDIRLWGKSITVRSENGPNHCTIDCQQLRPHRAFYLVDGESADTVISSFTLVGGRINRNGGAIYCKNSGPTFENCIFTDNTAGSPNMDYGDGCGGAVYCIESSPFFIACTFINNRAWGSSAYFEWPEGIQSVTTNGFGGAVACIRSSLVFQDCIFDDNVAWGGNGLAHSLLMENGGTAFGGGMYIEDGDVQIINCRFDSNRASGGNGGDYYCGGPGRGGAVYSDSESSLTIADSQFNTNIAESGDHGRDAEYFTNCLCECDTRGGAIACGGTAILTNCLIQSNIVRSPKMSGEYFGYPAGSGIWGGDYLRNCTVVSNQSFGSDIEIVLNCPNPPYWLGTAVEGPCLIDSIVWGNMGEKDTTPSLITSDPLFVSGPQGDYYLSQIISGQTVNSPYVDAGSDTAANLGMHRATTRTDGFPDTGMVDMGYHYPLAVQDCIADLDGNGRVDMQDFIGLSEQWDTDWNEPVNQSDLPEIVPGQVILDGELSDWPEETEWILLNQVYDGAPTDISDARFALRWNDQTNRLYAAVVVTDTDQVFSDGYESWNAGDRIEVYCQGSAAGGTDWQGDYDIAQHYYIARNSDDSSWASWADGQPVATDVGLEYAVSLSGAVIVYEAAIKAFDTYGGLTGGTTVETDLEAGKVIGFDITALTRTASGGYGMLSANTMTGKYQDASQFAQYMLVPAGDCEDLTADLDGDCVVDLDDLAILAENWLWP